MLLSSDGTLWQERLGEAEPWRPIEKLTSSRCEALLRTVAAIVSDGGLKSRSGSPDLVSSANLWDSIVPVADQGLYKRRQNPYSDLVGARFR
jgi:hypothetical protein